jgi:hypothetical protein
MELAEDSPNKVFNAARRLTIVFTAQVVLVLRLMGKARHSNRNHE